MLRGFLLIISLIFLSIVCQAQHLQILHTDAESQISLRGLSAVTSKVIWVSGSGGTVGLSTNGGQSWKWICVPHFEKTEFRDVEAFSDREAIIMGITQPAVILYTTDGGDNWKIVFEDTSRNAFLDAMDFTGDHAAVVGDPINHQIFFAESSDRGKSWNIPSATRFQPTAEGESFFAASGSNIQHLANGSWVLISGGKKSCIYFDSFRMPLLLSQGKETTGANSIAVNPFNKNQAFIVGGDFKVDTARSGNSLLIQFNPFCQTAPEIPPHGYRSCVEYININHLICCGTTGVDITADGGLHWRLISEKSFHVCSKSKMGNDIFLAGAHRTIAWWDPGY